MSEPLIAVENLRIGFPASHGVAEAVRGVSLTLGRERLGIVGESGSGKSLTARALLGLVRPPARVTADRLTIAGADMRHAAERRWREIRGRQVSLVMQDPKFSLNPVMTIGAQIAESVRLRDPGASRRAVREAVLAMLEAVRIREPERVAGLYPHQVSGGMGQRAMIAAMLVLGPAVLIADEPTSALDMSVQNQVLGVLDDLVAQRGMGLILISHDLTLVSSFCDRLLVMYRGRVVEALAASDLARATHPYTRGLLASMPRLDDARAVLPTLARDRAWAG